MNPVQKNLTPVKFQFYSLTFTPYKSINKGSITILTDIINYLSKEMFEGRGYLIDRHSERKIDGPRELFMTSAVFMHRERRIKCSLALLRSGRIPMLKPTDKFQLVPLDTTLGSIAEQTHFFIDYSRNNAVLCVEFNYNGPRISDIEYYFRSVARDALKIARVTEVLMYMDSSIDKALSELKNVLHIDIKIQPVKISQLDLEVQGEYFSGMNNIGNKLKPKFIKIEAMFQTPGSTVKSSQLNDPANKYVLGLIRKFKAKPLNIDCFENFVVKYEDNDGEENVFNLLKGKKEIIKEIDLNIPLKNKEWYQLIEEDFDEFIKNLSNDR